MTASLGVALKSGPSAGGPFAEVPIFQMLTAFHRIYDIWRSLVEVIIYPDFAFQRPKQLIPAGVKRNGLCIEVLPDDI